MVQILITEAFKDPFLCERAHLIFTVRKWA
jgi:hypothetical protein